MLIVDPFQGRMVPSPQSAGATSLPRMIDDNLSISIKSKLAGLAFMSVNLLCLGWRKCALQIPNLGVC